MHRISRFTFLWTVLALILSVTCSSISSAQRLSDKDLEQRIKNLNNDSKKFQSFFNNALSKSSIRKTSQAKDARKLADDFTKSSKSLYDYFKRTKKSDPYLQNTLDYARQLEKLQSSVQLDSATSTQWTKVRIELNDIANAFHVPVR
jgi:Rad3-related DNA helicase